MLRIPVIAVPRWDNLEASMTFESTRKVTRKAQSEKRQTRMITIGRAECSMCNARGRRGWETSIARKRDRGGWMVDDGGEKERKGKEISSRPFELRPDSALEERISRSEAVVL